MGSRLPPNLPTLSSQQPPPDRLGHHQKSAIAPIMTMLDSDGRQEGLIEGGPNATSPVASPGWAHDERRFKVFISYSRQDSAPYAQHLVEALEARGLAAKLDTLTSSSAKNGSNSLRISSVRPTLWSSLSRRSRSSRGGAGGRSRRWPHSRSVSCPSFTSLCRPTSFRPRSARSSSSNFGQASISPRTRSTIFLLRGWPRASRRTEAGFKSTHVSMTLHSIGRRTTANETLCCVAARCRQLSAGLQAVH
jgi:hypothetical protein